MEALFAAMREDSQIERFGSCFARRQGQSLVYGLAGAQKHAAFAACFAQTPRTTVVVTHSRESVEGWRQDLMALLPEVPVVELPEMDLMAISAAAKSVELWPQAAAEYPAGSRPRTRPQCLQRRAGAVVGRERAKCRHPSAPRGSHEARA